MVKNRLQQVTELMEEGREKFGFSLSYKGAKRKQVQKAKTDGLEEEPALVEVANTASGSHSSTDSEWETLSEEADY